MQISHAESVLPERQQRLVAYWKSKQIAGTWPGRRDINPGDVLGALSTVSLVEWSSEGFRFRLTGSRLRDLFGGNVQGKLISHIDKSVEEAGSASMDLALETGRPVSGSRQVMGRWHFWLRLPLLDEQGRPRLVLCADELCDDACGGLTERRSGMAPGKSDTPVAA